MKTEHPAAALSPPASGQANTRRRAFTYVEIVICLALMTLILGCFAVALNGGADSFVRSSAKGVMSARVRDALDALEHDLIDTSESTIATFTDGLPANQCVVVLASARDSSGTVHLGSDYRPAWQAAVVYCPFTTSKGVRQLRRYVYYDTGYQFPFESCSVTNDTLTLVDGGETELSVDRQDGNPAADPRFQALCPGMIEWTVEPGSPTAISIKTTFLTRKGVTLEVNGVSHVGQRN